LLIQITCLRKGTILQYFETNKNTSFNEKFDIIKMFEFFFIDSIIVMFGGRVFQQTVGIPMGTNCARLHADLFLYSYEADFIQELLKKTGKKITLV